MQAEEIQRILDLCRAAGVAGVEVGPDTFKASFFPRVDTAPLADSRDPVPSPTAREPDPDTTMAALMAQSGAR